MVDILIRAGWKATQPMHQGAGDTFVFEQKGDDGLILEERDDGLCLWIEGAGDRRVFALEPGDKLDAVLQAIVSMQSTLTVGNYLGHYTTLSGLCPVAIVAWEQFPGMADAPAGSGGRADPKAAAQAAAQAIAEGKGGDADPLVFPNGPVKKLSDYVALMRLMQTGDMQGAMKKFGLDMGSYAAVMTAWGQALAKDASLSVKFGQMMAG